MLLLIRLNLILLNNQIAPPSPQRLAWVDEGGAVNDHRWPRGEGTQQDPEEPRVGSERRSGLE